MIEVTTEDIAYAESILLGDGGHFEEAQRVPFIKDFRTLDVQAVPGSGKTTALLAKLLILERKLPFADGAGVLVLSHTNTAVDKITEEISDHCPKLFTYPNFVGTIQSFADKFLAVQECINLYGIRPIHIDTSLYGKSMSHVLASISRDVALKKKYENPQALFYARHKKEADEQAGKMAGVSASSIVNDLVYDDVTNLRIIAGTKKVVNFRNGQSLINEDDAPKNRGFKYCIWETMKKGIIPYDFAYDLANRLAENPDIVEMIRKRFPFVFVDEMQDMSVQQVVLLERLFGKNDGNSCFQRIGDINQSIFEEKLPEWSKADADVWRAGREVVLTISGTHRFGSIHGAIIEKFGLSVVPIESLTNCAGEAPKLILYKAERIKEVLPLYAKLVSAHMANEPTLYDGKYPIKAVGWRKESDKGISLLDYFDGYSNIETGVKKNGPSLLAELEEARKASQKTAALLPIHKALWRGLFLSLKFEDSEISKVVKNIRALKDDLGQTHADFYESLKLRVYGWCTEILDGGLETIHGEIVTFVSTEFLVLYGAEYSGSRTYLENKLARQPAAKPANLNVFHCDATGIEFEVCTVHSVKGETHAATLYLETFYYNDGGKSYESQRLLDQLRGNQIDEAIVKSREKKSTKMIYVGFSRAKYLLCFAANQHHFTEDDLDALGEMGWDIRTDLC